MEIRKLGWTELSLTTVGLGTWAIGGGNWQFGWGPQDDKESVNTILYSIESGINWIDTAAVYGLGHSEEIVGRAIKRASSKPIIATKCGLIWDKRRHVDSCLKKESIRREVEASLKRLDIDVIDLYQIHWPMPDGDIEEAWTEIGKLIKEGKLRYAGVSNFSIPQIERCQSIHKVASLQPPYSMLRREIEKGLLDYCSKNEIGVIVYSPMERGLLTGKFTKDRVKKLPENDHRRTASPFQEPQLSANLDFVEKLLPIAAKHNKTLAQLAIAWTLRRPEVTSAIVGAREAHQVEENIKGSDYKLLSEDIEHIENLLNVRNQKISQAT